MQLQAQLKLADTLKKISEAAGEYLADVDLDYCFLMHLHLA